MFFRKRLGLRPTRILELPDEVLCAAVSPNEKFIAFGLLDNTARVYFLDTLKFFVSLYGHSLPVTCIDIDSVISFEFKNGDVKMKSEFSGKFRNRNWWLPVRPIKAAKFGVWTLEIAINRYSLMTMCMSLVLLLKFF